MTVMVVTLGVPHPGKHIHWMTFERLTEKHDSLVTTSLVGLIDRLGMREM